MFFVTDKLEKNLTINHKIPLGALVEIVDNSMPENGSRLFVVNHSRDCDGTPLYDLSFDKEAHKEYEEILNDNFLKQNEPKVWNIQQSFANGKIARHYSGDCLKVINIV